jgi:acetoin utilization protein AcuB
MADNKIGGLPVTDDGKLVGIITETDIFKILLELLGARTPGVRVIVAVPEAKGVLAQITRALADLGANIVSVATYGGPNADEPRIMFKLSDVAPEAVKQALQKLGLAIIDFRTV